jgi:hypothetical protein
MIHRTLQQMCRSETINRRVRYKLIEKLDKVLFFFPIRFFFF